MKNGPLAGYNVDSLYVKLYHGSFHDVDSDALSFEMAARIGFKEAAKTAKPQLLEPIMSVEVFTFLTHHLQLMGCGKVSDDFQFKHPLLRLSTPGRAGGTVFEYIFQFG